MLVDEVGHGETATAGSPLSVGREDVQIRRSGAGVQADVRGAVQAGRARRV